MQQVAATPPSRHAPSQTEAQQLLVAHAFTAADPCELSLPAGAVVTLLRNAMAAGEGWCVVQDEHGQTGLAPISHLGGISDDPKSPHSPKHARSPRLAPGGGHVMLTLDNFQIDKVPPTRRVAMEGLARQERARGSGTAVLSGFKRMIWKAVLLRVTADGIEVRKAKDPSVLLASIRNEAIEDCGIVNDAPEGFHITCKDLLRLQFCGACPGDALCWLRAVMHNAPRAVRIDAEYNAKCAWDVHAGMPRGGEVRGLPSPARCATEIANNAGRSAGRCAKQLRFGNAA